MNIHHCLHYLMLVAWHSSSHVSFCCSAPSSFSLWWNFFPFKVSTNLRVLSFWFWWKLHVSGCIQFALIPHKQSSYLHVFACLFVEKASKIKSCVFSSVYLPEEWYWQWLTIVNRSCFNICCPAKTVWEIHPFCINSTFSADSSAASSRSCTFQTLTSV